MHLTAAESSFRTILVIGEGDCTRQWLGEAQGIWEVELQLKRIELIVKSPSLRSVRAGYMRRERMSLLNVASRKKGASNYEADALRK